LLRRRFSGINEFETHLGALGDFNDFYFAGAGAGAVAQAAALCLGSSDFTGTCTAVDKDNLELTNDNRYALSTRGDDAASRSRSSRVT
jgi:tRNA A37 threonylcarbamoyladenosine dehydratase